MRDTVRKESPALRIALEHGAVLKREGASVVEESSMSGMESAPHASEGK
jgi:hypothetical protein